MLASSWLDLVLGVDIHLHLVPSPAGPVPTPIPQPYMGLVGDPVGMVFAAIRDTAISLVQSGHLEMPSGPVLINGLPANTTDEISKNKSLLPHMPMPPGTAHVKPPSGEASFPLGAINVTFGGNNAVRLGEIALSCADPVALPTSKVIVIPKGPPVMVMGAPAFNVQRAIAKWAMGKLIRTAWKGVSRLAKYAGKLSASRLRNLFAKAKCAITGHPVDIATGRVFTEVTDFALPGALPLAFTRTYFSSWSHRDSVLGPGWSHSLDLALWFETDSAVFRNAEGQEIVFDLLDAKKAEVGREIFEPISRNTLVRGSQGWRVITPEGVIHHFAKVEGEPDPRPGYMRVVRSTRRHPNVAITYNYDRHARLVEVIDSAGRVVRLEYAADRKLARLLLPDPEQSEKWLKHVEFVHTAEGLLVEARDALGRATRYEYDGRLMVQETNRNGVSFFWMYDGRGAQARCVRTWGVSGDEVIYNQKLDYDIRNRTTLVTDSYDYKTLYKMDPLGAVVEVTDALGGKVTREYDDALQVIAETDPLGNKTKHHYGPRGQLVMTVFADGSQRVMKYDPRFPELMTLFRDEAGAVWRHTYDDHGQIVETKGPEGDSWRRHEWEDGQLKANIEATGARTEVLERDRWKNPIKFRLPNGATATRAYDRRGRLVQVTNAYDGRFQFAYDVLDRLVESREPDGNTRRLRLDPEGNVLEVTDRCKTVRFTYSHFNKVASREDGASEGTAGDTVRFAWGREGELLEVRNERNHEYKFFYDPCGRLERELGFDLQETRYRRDMAGRLLRIEKPKAGVHQEVTQDVRGRVTETKYSDGTWAKFVYRRDGALVEATNETTTVTFERDRVGRVVKETQGDVQVSSHYTGGTRVRMESTLGA